MRGRSSVPREWRQIIQWSSAEQQLRDYIQYADKQELLIDDTHVAGSVMTLSGVMRIESARQPGKYVT